MLLTKNCPSSAMTEYNVMRSTPCGGAALCKRHGPVNGEINWCRRFDHMQQHSGQHLLSAVFEEFAALRTVSFHLGAESSTIALEGGPIEAQALMEVERRANELVFENRPIDIR